MSETERQEENEKIAVAGFKINGPNETRLASTWN
jgi:hypothetical protein